MLGQLTDWVITIVDSLGYVGVALLVTLENVFPPIPSELVLALAGFVASRGDASLIGMIVAATVGSLLGAWILYGAAYLFGPGPVRARVATLAASWARELARAIGQGQARGHLRPVRHRRVRRGHGDGHRG